MQDTCTMQLLAQEAVAKHLCPDNWLISWQSFLRGAVHGLVLRNPLDPKIRIYEGAYDELSNMSLDWHWSEGRETDEDGDRCESCGARSEDMRHDDDGVPLCPPCYRALLEECEAMAEVGL